MRIVLDTNVLVSGLLRRHGNPAFILRLVFEREIELALDERILQEYEDVLARPKFRFSHALRTAVLGELRAVAVFAGLPAHAVRLPDAADQPFLEVALALNAEALITGNLRHFPAQACAGIRVISPAQFMEVWGSLRGPPV